MKRFIGTADVLVAGIILGAVLYACAPEFLRTESAEPPANFVAVSERIDTSGQLCLANSCSDGNWHLEQSPAMFPPPANDQAWHSHAGTYQTVFPRYSRRVTDEAAAIDVAIPAS